MIIAMFFGMSMSLGRVPAPWSHLCNALLLLQFPLTHSLLLGPRGGRLLNRVIPVHGQTLSTTTYAIVASIQLLLLFALWTRRASSGGARKAWSSGPSAPSMRRAGSCSSRRASMPARRSSRVLRLDVAARQRRPSIPTCPWADCSGSSASRSTSPLPDLWTVPVWTPDQLVIALAYTAYCLLAPMLKERRFATRYGARFEAYQSAVPMRCRASAGAGIRWSVAMPTPSPRPGQSARKPGLPPHPAHRPPRHDMSPSPFSSRPSVRGHDPLRIRLRRLHLPCAAAKGCGPVIRQAFPHFYLFVLGTSVLAAGLAAPAKPMLGLVLALIAITVLFARRC